MKSSSYRAAGVAFLLLHQPWGALFVLRAVWKQGRTQSSRASTSLQTLDVPGFPQGWEESHPLLIVLGIFFFLVFSRRAPRTHWYCLARTLKCGLPSVKTDRNKTNEMMCCKRQSHTWSFTVCECVEGKKERSWELQIFGLFALIFMFSPQWKTTLKRTLLTHLTMYNILLKM